MLFEEDELSDFLAGLIVFDQSKKVEALIYTKSAVWQHENEWRIFAGDGRDKYALFEDIPFGAKELTGVVFGCRMPRDQQKILTSIIERRYPHAEILKAAPADHSFQLELNAYESN